MIPLTGVWLFVCSTALAVLLRRCGIGAKRGVADEFFLDEFGGEAKSVACDDCDD